MQLQERLRKCDLVIIQRVQDGPLHFSWGIYILSGQ